MIRLLSNKRLAFQLRKPFSQNNSSNPRFRDLLPLVLPEKRAFIQGFLTNLGSFLTLVSSGVLMLFP